MRDPLQDPTSLYGVADCLGQGGQGAVYKAVRMSDGQDVAFKRCAMDAEENLRLHAASLRACWGSAGASSMLVIPQRVGVWHDGACGRYNKRMFAWEEQPLVTGMPLTTAVPKELRMVSGALRAGGGGKGGMQECRQHACLRS